MTEPLRSEVHSRCPSCGTCQQCGLAHNPGCKIAPPPEDDGSTTEHGSED